MPRLIIIQIIVPDIPVTPTQYARPAPNINVSTDELINQHESEGVSYPRPAVTVDHSSVTQATSDRQYTGDMPGGFFVTVEKHVDDEQVKHVTSTPHVVKTPGMFISWHCAVMCTRNKC